MIADGTANEDFDAFVQRWLMLQAQVQAVIGCNQVACFASLDQGKSLARVAKQLLESDADGDSGGRHAMFLDVLQGHDSHLAPVFGATGACLEMPEEEVCRLLGFCAARDMISATVRLALIGPLAGVRMLSTIDEAVEDGYRSSQRAIRACDGDPVEAAGASAPVIETIHPCHEILQTRLFRS
uniref:Urease accessory protein UreF n=1 Tax=Craspedostauros australis TaxID=1486917 RepID=A0A7R9WQE7_9STRA